MHERPQTTAADGISSAKWLPSVRFITLLAFAAATLAYVVISWRWPLVWDMQVMHYVSFLIDRGWAPYRQIRDMNLPGAYLFEGWALHLFGPTDLGWRLYDFSLGGILIAAMITIARRYDWIAGLVAGALFLLLHGAEGPREAGQRDQVMAVVLMVAFALCLEAVRWRKPWLMLPFGLAAGLVTSIKPTLVLAAPLLLILAVRELRRGRERVAAYVWFTVAGVAASGVILLSFLLRHHCLTGFLNLFTNILPNYLTLGVPTWGSLIKHTLQPPLYLIVALAVVLAVINRVWRNWEQSALLLGVLLGAINYYGQRKGFLQHRYSLLVFLLLWMSIQIFLALRGPRTARFVACAAILLMLLYIPRELWWQHRWPDHDDFSADLEHDLQTLGPGQLQNRVQCLDIVDGCLTALYHLKLVQSTGATGDLLLFQPNKAPATLNAHTGFWNMISSDPPTVFVVSNWYFGHGRSFDKLDAWPLFARMLDKDYVCAMQRQFPELLVARTSGPKNNDSAYRIYVRRDSPVVRALPVLNSSQPPYAYIPSSCGANPQDVAGNPETLKAESQLRSQR